MRPVVRVFWGFLALTAVLWLLVEDLPAPSAGLLAMRGSMVQLSGVLAIGCMSLAVILAARPRWPERLLGGLDRMYRLHKWLGVAALALATMHWLWAKGPKWAAALGLLERRARGPRPPADGELEQLFRSMRGTAETAGEWAFYGVALLVIVALARRIPYHVFCRTHRLVAVLYLALVFHAVILARFSYWTTPLGLLLGALLACGAVAAAMSLTRRIGAGRKVKGEITRLHYYPGLRVLEGEIAVPHGWPGHRAGQFAFLSGDPATEDPHPFTIASAWDPQARRLKFLTRELGDFTGALRQRLRVGQRVVVEGPYGCFTFDDDRPAQVWVAGGIGVTPFIARMHDLALRRRAGPDAAPRQEIHLFHATPDDSPEGEARLRQDAEAAGVTLHVVNSRRDGRLTGERIRAMAPRWREASIWFCGPPAFGAALRRDFARHGVDTARRFHQELFDMR
ncbi:ferric reductase-like transmembrane domain-containing protein [Camelimonas abortus]|uniref:Ferric reductase-like transmembrane domain-containing protein n=1 Tax=Camelimonas abortus TaxID=1017184 RepID=A0ABV7LCS1_9HYPH